MNRNDVVAFVAEELVGAALTVDDIVAGERVNDLVRGVADEDVIENRGGIHGVLLRDIGWPIGSMTRGILTFRWISDMSGSDR